MNNTYICPLCGKTILDFLLEGIPVDHWGCYITGIWTRGYKNKNDWIIDCLKNGNRIISQLGKNY